MAQVTIAAIDSGAVLIALLLSRTAITAETDQRIFLNEVPRELTQAWAQLGVVQRIAPAQAVTKTLVIEITEEPNSDEGITGTIKFILHALANSEAAARALLAVVAGDLEGKTGLGLWAGAAVCTLDLAASAESGKMDETEYCFAKSEWTALIAA